jgi:hypothetical protein
LVIASFGASLALRSLVAFAWGPEPAVLMVALHRAGADDARPRDACREREPRASSIRVAQRFHHVHNLTKE